MIGLGTILNISTIIIGSIIGLFLNNNLKNKYKKIMIQGIGLTTIVVGIFGAIEGFFDSNEKYIFLVVILSIVVGSIIGTYFQLNKKINNIGYYFECKLSIGSSNFSQGFISASLIFCVGAMSILGAINDGMYGDYTILVLKSILDGITSIILASSLGLGVLFSFITVLIYQGIITLLAYYFGQIIPLSVRNQIIIIGNIMIIGIGLNLLEIKKINIIDMLPAILIPIIYCLIRLLF